MRYEQVSQKLAYCAKILLVFSVTLLIYGIILDINSNQHLIDSTVESEIPQDNGNSVTVSTIDDTDINSTGNGTATTPVDGSAESTARTEQVPLSIDEQNELLREQIQNEYGVVVRFGSETTGYTITSGDQLIKTEPITDPALINSQLVRLKNALDLYPKGLFLEIKSGGIPLTIYLVDHFSNIAITGITDSSYSFANISIAAMYPFEESFFHESYHYIERYLFKKKANYTSWDSLNPEGFEYGTVRNDWSYNNTFSQEAYFVNNYAQAAATEDRASTFEYMMAPTKASCLNENMPVWKKAKYMARTMELTLRCVNSDTEEYWERFL